MQLSLCKFSRQDNTRLPGEIQLSKDNFKNKFCLINHYDERIDPILHVLKRLSWTGNRHLCQCFKHTKKSYNICLAFSIYTVFQKITLGVFEYGFRSG